METKEKVSLSEKASKLLYDFKKENNEYSLKNLQSGVN